MTQKTWPSLEEWEIQVKKITSTKHKHELHLVERLLNCYLTAFRALDRFTPSKYNELEHAWLLLTTRTFNSLRCAYDFLQKGYYSQAVMLIRAAEEDYLTCRDCEVNEGTIDALLNREGELGKGKLRFSEMAKRISPEFYKKVWKVNYGRLSRIAHPRRLALRILTNLKTNKLALGGDYDNDLFIDTCHALLRNAVGMTEFLVRILGKNAPQWQKDSYPAFQAARAYVEKISKEAKTTAEKKE